jgi:ATP synthase protein I
MMPPGRSHAFRIVGVQLAASFVVALLLLVIGGVHAWSALAGGLISALGNGLAAARIFVPYRAQEPEKLVGRFYGAELWKLALTGALFAAAILWIEPLSVGALFGGFLVIQLIPMLVTHFLE